MIPHLFFYQFVVGHYQYATAIYGQPCLSNPPGQVEFFAMAIHQR
jgi:hypothetical protein